MSESLTEPLIQPAGTAKKEVPFELRELHIDDFLDATYEVSRNPELALPHFLFTHWRKPATEKMLHERFMRNFKLFVDYEGETYRVIGASRLGDIWLTRDFTRSNGYDRRVQLVLAHFSNWRDFADRSLTWDERVCLGIQFYQLDVAPGVVPKICSKYTSFLARAGAPKQYLDCTAEERAYLAEAHKNGRL